MVRAILEQFVELNKAYISSSYQTGKSRIYIIQSLTSKNFCSVPVISDKKKKKLTMEQLLSEPVISSIKGISIGTLSDSER